MSRSSKEEFPFKLRRFSDFLSIMNKLRTRSISNIPELKVKDLLNDQEFDKYILDIRELLVSRVFVEIQQSFIDHNKVKYVVNGAYESWKKITCLNFFFHSTCNEFAQKYSSWRSDLEPEISEPDSWCRGNISMKNREFLVEEEEKDTVLSDYQLIKVEKYPKQNYFEKPTVRKELIKLYKKEPSFEQLYHTGQKERVQLSVLNVPFQLTVTSPADSERIDESIIVNKIYDTTPDEETAFYRNIKREEVNLPCVATTPEARILPPKKLGSFSRDEDLWTKKYSRKISFPPLRLNPTINVKTRGNTMPTALSVSKSSSNLRRSTVEFAGNVRGDKSSYRFYHYSL